MMTQRLPPSDFASAPAFYRQEESYALFQPEGKMSWAEAVTLVRDAVLFANRAKARRLLIDVTGLSGFKVPGTAERYQLGLEVAAVVIPDLRIAMVVNPDLVDPERFGLNQTKTRGDRGEIFCERDEALSWLLSRCELSST